MRIRGYLGIFIMLALQFAGLLLLYFLLRLGFYALNKDLFADVDMPRLLPMLAGGVRFDVVALLYLNILYILMWVVPVPFKFKPWWQRIAKYLFVITNSIGVALNLIDMAYYPFTLKRTTATVVEQFRNETNYGQLLGDFLVEYWFLLIVFVLLIYVLIRLITFFKIARPTLGWKFYALHTVGMLAVAFLFVGGVRGGWAHSTRPITLSNAGDYVQSPEEMSIVLTTPFAMMKSLEAVYLREVYYYTPQELDTL